MVKTWSTPVKGEEQRPVPCTLCGGADFAPHFRCTGENPDIDKENVFTYVRCRGCGLIQINPQPSPAAVLRRYAAAGENSYLAYERANEGPFLRLQELALKDAGFFEEEPRILKECRESGTQPVVLDLGCATGALLSALKVRGWFVRGVEISGPQAEYCRRRGLDVSSHSLEESRFPGAFFDAILASHVLEHVNDPDSFVREAARICKTGGRFYVTTPNIAGFQARLFGPRWRSAIFDHLYLFSAKTLGALLARTGFSVERVVTWGGLAAGTVPEPVKKTADCLAKILNLGDVMIVRARRQ